jgi:hypothetical protein
MARDRGIQPYIVNWNIFVSVGFKAAYDTNATADTDPENGLACTDEIVLQYNKECVTAVINQYPDLVGLGVSFGDRMHGMDTAAQVRWVERVFYDGIKSADREVALLFRALFSSGGESDIRIARRSLEASGLKTIWVQIKFNWSHGHSLTKLVQVHNEDGAGGGLGGAEAYWDPVPTKYRVTWMVRNEDFFALRWGSARYIREHVNANYNRSFVGGYAVGSEGYIPAREYFYAKNMR